MIIHATQPLFAWDSLEDSPSLSTLRSLLESIPDADLLEGLRRARGRGRDDYPVHVLWGVVLLTIALRHTTTEACLAELHRNEGLRRLIGIESEAGVPRKWNMSRFHEVLGKQPHLDMVQRIFDMMIQRLGSSLRIRDAMSRATRRGCRLDARRRMTARSRNSPRCCPRRRAAARSTTTTAAR